MEEENEERNRIKEDSEADIIQNHVYHSMWLDMNWLMNKFIAP